jgi:hypothetical protein
MLDQTLRSISANVVVFTGEMPKLQITLSEVLILSLSLLSISTSKASFPCKIAVLVCFLTQMESCPTRHSPHGVILFPFILSYA